MRSGLHLACDPVAKGKETFRRNKCRERVLETAPPSPSSVQLLEGMMLRPDREKNVQTLD